MADSFTANYNFTLPEVGGSDDTWGTKLNANWSSIDGTLKQINDSAVKITGAQSIAGQKTFTGQQVYTVGGTATDPQNRFNGTTTYAGFFMFEGAVNELRASHNGTLRLGIGETSVRAYGVPFEGSGALLSNIPFGGLASAALATQAEAATGTANNKLMTALRVSQRITAWFTGIIATTAEAVAGTVNNKIITPLRMSEFWTSTRNGQVIGWGQTWQNLTAQRPSGTAFQNNTGRPIMISVRSSGGGGTNELQISEDGTTWTAVAWWQPNSVGGFETHSAQLIIPPSMYYRKLGNTEMFLELR